MQVIGTVNNTQASALCKLERVAGFLLAGYVTFYSAKVYVQQITFGSFHHQQTKSKDNIKMIKSNLAEYGWADVPRNRSNIPSDQDAKTANVEVDFEKIWPKTKVVESAMKYVKETLPQETYNHSLRVYCFGKQQHLSPR